MYRAYVFRKPSAVSSSVECGQWVSASTAFSIEKILQILRVKLHKVLGFWWGDQCRGKAIVAEFRASHGKTVATGRVVNSHFITHG